jgi:hypothetical protein
MGCPKGGPEGSDGKRSTPGSPPLFNIAQGQRLPAAQTRLSQRLDHDQVRGSRQFRHEEGRRIGRADVLWTTKLFRFVPARRRHGQQNLARDKAGAVDRVRNGDQSPSCASRAQCG